MNKSPVLALVSLFFVASVASFPLNEPTIDGFVNDLPLDQNEELTNYNEDFTNEDELFDDQDLGDDVDVRDNNHIENFVLGHTMPTQVKTGACYQECKSTTDPTCKNAKPSDVKKFTMGQMNYCVYECSKVNTNCFKRY